MDRARLLRLVGAGLVLVGGAVHLKLQLDEYGTEGIGRTFALNAIASGLVVLYLVLRRDLIGPLAAIVVSAGTLVGFALSRVGDGLLDFRERGFDAPYSLLTVVTEALALVALGAVIMAERRPTSSPRS